MSSEAPRHSGEERPATSHTSMLDSFGMFALIVMGTFAIAIVFAIIGLTYPSWLGFS